MAKYRHRKAHEPLRELPRVELIPVYESKAEFEKRVQDVRILLARMVMNSKKRGRPTEKVWEEELDAA